MAIILRSLVSFQFQERALFGSIRSDGLLRCPNFACGAFRATTYLDEGEWQQHPYADDGFEFVLRVYILVFDIND